MVTPASSCVNCHTNGLVSEDQRRYTPGGAGSATLQSRTRFYCPKCLRVWIADTPEAIELGRFLDRARLRP